MDCLKPISVLNRLFECGRCQPCVRYRRRVWTHRLILEAKTHDASCFVTLTYKTPPPGNSLNPVHAQNWLKDIRHAYEPKKLRFFLSGEYGDTNQRPHYHALLFGVDALSAGGPYGDGGLVAKTWKHGFTCVRPLTESRCSYVAGYVDKKIAGKEPPRALPKRTHYTDGRYGQFTRMSLRPGIGFYASQIIGNAFQNGSGWIDYVQTNGDVPTALRHGKILLPLGRYLRGKIRESLPGDSSKPEPGVQYRQTLSQWHSFLRMQELQRHYAAVASLEKKLPQEIMLDTLKQKSYNVSAREAVRKPTRNKV